MSTWINKIPLAAALLALAACLPAGGTGGDLPVPSHKGPPPLKMGVAGGEIIIAGPKGFCVDRSASQDAGGRSALTVLSSCRTLGGGMFAPQPQAPAILTASVAPRAGDFPIEPAAPDLKAFFTSAQGRAALSRAGQARSVTLHESFASQGAYLMYLRDEAAFTWGAVQPDYWRALLPIGGRMVSLSVLALPQQPIDRAAGRALLEDFIASMRAVEASGQKVLGPKAAKGG